MLYKDFLVTFAGLDGEGSMFLITVRNVPNVILQQTATAAAAIRWIDRVGVDLLAHEEDVERARHG